MQPSRVAGAVELLVVRAGDVGDVAQRAAPRDLAQEVVGVDDVALDLEALVVGSEPRRICSAATSSRVEERPRSRRARRGSVCRAISASRSKPPCSSTVGSLALRMNVDDVVELAASRAPSSSSTAASLVAPLARQPRARAQLALAALDLEPLA